MDSSIEEVVSEEALTSIIKSNSLAVVHFWAPWCEPCKLMDSICAELAKKHPHVKFARVEAEELSDVYEMQGVTAVPCFLLFKDGKVLHNIEGSDPPALTEKVAGLAEHAPKAVVAGVTDAGLPGDVGGDINARIKRLLNSSNVMLFMKGTPEEPRCGFSKKVVEALRGAGVPFGSFDILRDEAVRQGLKTYSDWPTYPQLYVKAELLGGCDIVLELQAAGELKDTVNEMLNRMD